MGGVDVRVTEARRLHLHAHLAGRQLGGHDLFQAQWIVEVVDHRGTVGPCARLPGGNARLGDGVLNGAGRRGRSLLV